MDLEIQSAKFNWPLYLADIGDDLLIGCDMLDGQDFVVSSRQGIRVRNEWVPCEVLRQPVGICAIRLTNSEKISVPAQHEVLVSVPIDFPIPSDRFAVVEPVVENDSGFMMARCLVDLWADVIPLRVVNTSEELVSIPAGSLLGRLEPVVNVSHFGTTDLSISRTTMKVTEGQVESRSEDKDDGTVPEDVLLQEVTGMPSHLEELYMTTARTIMEEPVRHSLRSLLIPRQDAFAKSKLDLGTFKGIEHDINTAFAVPVRQRIRPTPKGFQDEEKKCLDEQIDAGVVRPSSSPWASPTVLVRKPDGSVRYCVDFRQVNDRTLKDAYPLPRIDMCLNSLGGVRFFSTLDLQSGYWQIKVAESDILKTAFITKYGLYEYKKMPFDLCNGPSTFQRCMELVFRGLQWNTLLIYLDDIIVMGHTMQENLDRLDEVLSRLAAAGLKLKPSKCHLLLTEVLFLGHTVSAAGLRPNPRLVECVSEWHKPTNRKEVQQFLGLCNYYRRFVPHFSEIAAPVTALTSKNVTFIWSDESHTSFQRLKQALCSAPLLALPQDEGTFVLDADASDVAVGGVLHQVQQGVENVIAYTSKKLDRQQKRYCVTRPVNPSPTEPAANLPETEPSAPVASATPATPVLPATPELASSSLGVSKADTAVLAAEMASKLMRPLLEEVSSKLLSPVLDRMERRSMEIRDALCAMSSRSRSPAHHRRETHSGHSSRSGHKSSKRDRASSNDDRHGKKKK